MTMSGFELYNVEDSFSILRNGADREFDVVITDPPYDPHCQANQISGTAMKAHVEAGSGAIPHLELPFAALDGYEFTKDLVRVAERWAIVFCTVEAFGDLARMHGRATECGSYTRGALWYKMNAQGQLTGDRPANAYEGVACLHRPDIKKRWNGHGSYGFWPCNSTRGKADRHPNEKPLDLCLKLVALFTERGETVFDPFCGMSAIGEACLLLGRHYVGLDIFPKPITGAEWWGFKTIGQRKRLAEELGIEDAKGVSRKTAPPEHAFFLRDDFMTPDWVALSKVRLAPVLFGSMTDEAALKLCTAKKSEMVEEL